MLRPLIRLLSSLWRPFGRRGGGGGGGDGAAGRERLLWSRDLGCCAGGEFSMAVVQANRVLEDQSRIESGPFGTFVGVYDGHGGPDAARYVCDHLFAPSEVASRHLPLDFLGNTRLLFIIFSYDAQFW
ncbi:hypothetical protein GW17_00012495 [Ensete ventricosum]|nr:hypothetical protein GW17_00012495 [Ensete ventricosum]